MRTSYLSALFLVSSLSIVACSGGADHPAAEGTDPKSSSSSTTKAASDDDRTAVERCSGEFNCTSEAGPVQTTLTRVAGACHAGDFVLASDGSATANNMSGTWKSSTPNSFSLCFSAGCFSCSATNPVATSAPNDDAPKGKCTGSASSCDYRPAGSCGSQNGCRFAQHSHIDYKGDLQLEYECEGTPDSCSTFTDESSCFDQAGCRWN